jgi:hypothetical protein
MPEQARAYLEITENSGPQFDPLLHMLASLDVQKQVQELEPSDLVYEHNVQTAVRKLHGVRQVISVSPLTAQLLSGRLFEAFKRPRRKSTGILREE